MSIRPTELGWKGIVLLTSLGVAFFAAAYSNPFFLILVFCTTLGLLGAAWTVANLRGLRVEVPPSLLVAAGQDATLPVTVRVPGARAAFAVEVDVTLAAFGCATAAIDVARGRIDVSVPLPPLGRGVYAVHEVTLVTRFPFGMFAVRQRLPVACELAAHPRILDAAALRAAGGGTDGDDDRPTRRGRRGSSLRGLRPFRTGDAPGDVHWKATARRGAPVVKEREPEGAEAAAAVVVDLRATGEALEEALSRAATSLVRAVEQRKSIRFAAQGLTCTVRDRRTLARALHFLAGATALPADAPPPRPGVARA